MVLSDVGFVFTADSCIGDDPLLLIKVDGAETLS